MPYNAGRSLGAVAGGMSWGNSITNFQKVTKVAGLDMEKESEKISDKVGQFLKVRAEARTPIKTGKAKNSWAKSTSKSGRQRKVTVFNTAKTPKGLFYLNFVERGTIKIAPRRFFAKAIKESQAYEKRLYMKLNKKIARRFNSGKVT
jgi:HK97 gp10 family phage protein